jgi:protein-L-isoaspartate(D-aspartate) O-methyltransferase
VLAKLGARVFTIERHFDLLQSARARFDQFHFNIASKVGDGTVGWSDFAPYDRILVTAGSPDVPKSLKAQLADKGILIVPVGSEKYQDMTVVERRGSDFSVTTVDTFKFVPLIGKEGWSR